uniref:Sulfotransferase n=1 Tax=Alexandrium catenella TaxID=2925 RepID=A0A7S1LHU4_ALECA
MLAAASLLPLRAAAAPAQSAEEPGAALAEPAEELGAPCAVGCGAGGADAEAAALSRVSLLQSSLQRIRSASRAAPAAASPAAPELVFVHVPFNFGHTIERVAAFGPGLSGKADFMRYLDSYGSWSGNDQAPGRAQATQLPAVPGVAWGHISPALQAVSNATGCPMYYTPQKYWPEDLAQAYLGNKQVFGVLRDPYERLVAGFRGNIEKYGASAPELFSTCDVNSAVKKTMRMYLAGSQFAKTCSLLPQAEYFDGPHGITLPVDNRQFPSSMNTVFKEHGRPDLNISTEDIFHVSGCSEVWAGDLDSEARALVRQVYKRDFELLCQHFGYCNDEENTCIWQVPAMCPTRVLAAGYRGRA